jgi:DNA-binding CsgD family transcriptional regulator
VISFYDAAMGVTSWNASLSILGPLLSSRILVLFSQVPGKTQATFLGGIGLQPDTVRQYVEYFGARNVLMTEAPGLRGEGVGRTSETICDPSVLLKSEYYNDFLRPMDVRYSAAVTPMRNDECAIHVSAFREHRMAPFGTNDVQLLEQVYPHLRRALQLRLQLADREQRFASLENVLAGNSRGIAFINAAGKPVYVNDALQSMFDGQDGLLLTRDRITAADPRSARALRIAQDQVNRNGCTDTIEVTRPSGHDPYLVSVVPVLHRLGIQDSRSATALVVVTDPAQRVGPSADRLRKRFALTPMEAQVASAFATGLDLKEIAARYEISVHTARTHLKRILAKTSTSRQTELMRRLLLEMP